MNSKDSPFFKMIFHKAKDKQIEEQAKKNVQDRYKRMRNEL